MKHHPAVKQLLSDIERYLVSTGVEPTVFGRHAVRDGNFIQRLRGGRTPRLQTIDRVRAYMEKGKPR
jgi:hypothetical protein